MPYLLIGVTKNVYFVKWNLGCVYLNGHMSYYVHPAPLWSQSVAKMIGMAIPLTVVILIIWKEENYFLMIE